jgi:rhamnogalacturonan endolyase
MCVPMFILNCLIHTAAGRATEGERVLLFEDGFGDLRAGSLGSVTGAESEYHYLPASGPKGNWEISTFVSAAGSQLAWKVGRHADQPVVLQTWQNRMAHTHPMIVGGDDLWADYTVTVRFAPESDRGRSGLVFRYRNDRCYYFFGVSGPKAILKMVRHETAFHKPFERMLASKDCSWKPGRYLTAEVTVAGKAIRARLNENLELAAEDDTYGQGRIGLTADGPTRYAMVHVTAFPAEKQRVDSLRSNRERELKELRAANPKPVIWKKVRTEGFGVGRNLRFGDLDGDGRIDVLLGQVVHHGPKDAASELSCLTAMTFDGRVLWQTGEPDPWKDHLTNDVAFQVHDLDGDGHNEVIYCMNMELIVADGATGKVKRKVPTPETPKNTRPPYNKLPRILGDSMLFCDLRGVGRPSDILLKDRYQNVWALNARLEVMWHVQCNTGHYPYACDVDGDGKDEVAIGYSLFDHDGRLLWTLDNELKDHADGVAFAKLGADPRAERRWLCAASDEGFLLADLRGKVLRHLRLGHVQNPAIADFRPDLPGLETVTVNFWGNQGIIHFYDAEGNVYHDFEPFQHGSMCLPVNWTGKPPEYVVLSANVDDGGMFDGWGRRVVTFPADGHPDMCYAVLDITGDCRDEVVVWDPYEVWVYTQDDNPKGGRLYKPQRNALHNASNYQATLSLPGWSDGRSALP